LFDDRAHLANAFANARQLYLICRIKPLLNGRCVILRRTACIIIVGHGATLPPMLTDENDYLCISYTRPVKGEQVDE